MNGAAVKIYEALKEGGMKDQFLPSLETLAAEYGESLEAVQDGLGDLVYEGVLLKTKDCLYTTRQPYLWDVVRGNHSFTSEAKKRGQKPGNQILVFERRRAWPQIIQRLSLEEGEDVLVMERLLLADEKPVGLEFSYMPAKYYKDATREMFEGGHSTFKLMEEQGLIPYKAVDELDAAALEKRESELLGVAVGTPILVRFRVTLSPDGVPIKGSRAIYLFRPGYELKI